MSFPLNTWISIRFHTTKTLTWTQAHIYTLLHISILSYSHALTCAVIENSRRYFTFITPSCFSQFTVNFIILSLIFPHILLQFSFTTYFLIHCFHDSTYLLSHFLYLFFSSYLSYLHISSLSPFLSPFLS